MNAEPEPTAPDAAPEPLGVKDARLAARALERRWPLTPERRAELVEALHGIATDASAKKRERVAAARALIAAEGQNVADEHKAAPDQVEVSHTFEEALAKVYGDPAPPTPPAPGPDAEADAEP